MPPPTKNDDNDNDLCLQQSKQVFDFVQIGR